MGGGERLSKNTREPVWAAFVEIFRREFDDQCKCGHMLVRFEVRGCGAASEGCGAACSGHQPPLWLTRDSPQLFVSTPTFRFIPTFRRPDDSSRRKTDKSAQPRARTKPRARSHADPLAKRDPDDHRRHGKCTPTSAWNYHNQSTWWSTMGVRRSLPVFCCSPAMKRSRRRALLQVPDSVRTALAPE